MAEKLGVIDAQWILRRNASIQKSTPTFSYSTLMTSLIQSICKLTAERGYTHIICLWDKGPYKRAQMLEGFKGSRYYASTSDLIEITPEMTEEERLAAEAKNKEIQAELDYQNTIQMVKYSFIKHMGRFGFHSAIYQGYEADDLAFYIANYITISIPMEFYTLDSDWTYLMSDKCTFHRSHKYHPRDWTYHEAKTEELGDCELANRMELIEIGVMKDLYYGGHNDAGSIPALKQVNFSDACLLYKDNRLSEKLTPEELEDFNNHFKAMDARTHYTEDVKNYLVGQLNEDFDRIHSMTWDDFAFKKNINITSGYYNKFQYSQVHSQIADCIEIQESADLIPIDLD